MPGPFKPRPSKKSVVILAWWRCSVTMISAPCRFISTSKLAPIAGMDEPTGGLDVAVQARLLDLLRGLVVELNLAPNWD